MKSRNIAEFCKNAVGTVFLLAGAFFVCSTLLSMRAVLADPIAPVYDAAASAPQATRAGNNSARGNTANRASPRNNAATASRTTTASGRSVVNRTTAARTAVATPNSQNNAGASRATTASRTGNNASRTTATSSRGVATRANTSSRVGTSSNRAVRARTATGTQTARVSLQGNAIRGSKAVTSNSYTYLQNKLYTGNYSNIIDSTTGLISADAYSNCLESYYTCMDEICTARNASQGRCACAARAKAFAQAETALETANEELIKVSGELALLIATKGKDVSAAFKLTDAEQIMNCAAYAEVVAGGDADEITKWCDAHPEYLGSGNNVSVQKCSKSTAPSYCAKMGSTYGFSISDLNGNGSDILASLKAWADAKDNASKILINDNDSLLSAFAGVSDIVSGMGLGISTEETTLDSLANTWGYELFEYAHNNVCSRVLDSCFNGIYEACGTPPSGGKCANGGTSNCPYNYNSKITVSSAGDVTLNERGSSTTSTTSTSATCFGYTSTSGDPYSSLRGPVADSRRSVMQKYLLDANAACDVYGDQLRTAAQNIGYQKVAAQQALQQKRLEFYQEEVETTLAEATTAGTNFAECLSELIDCYETQHESEDNWSDSRIKTYCAQVANAPHCYQTMICSPSGDQFRAVIDVQDSTSCTYSSDYTKNTCRNIVSLNDILNTPSITAAEPKDGANNNSAAIREWCLQKSFVNEIRQWKSK